MLPDETYVVLEKNGVTTLHGNVRSLMKIEEADFSPEVYGISAYNKNEIVISYNINN
jgi:hypothetical protein